MRFEDEVLIWSNASIGPLFDIWESFTGRSGQGILGGAIERVWRPSWEAINLANRSLLEFGDDFCHLFYFTNGSIQDWIEYETYS